MNYQEFLQGKVVKHQASGFEVQIEDLNPMLFEWQHLIVRWLLFKGRSALFASCGLGKTPMQLEWAAQVHKHTGGNVLILAPLAVSAQTVREGEKFGIQVHKVRSQSEIKPGINITNYEMVEQFDPREFAGVVLDECFPAGTLIDMADGTQKPIEKVKKGEGIANANGTDTVQKMYKRQVYRAIQICIGGRKITCSENHPFFTVHGWKSAQDLQPGDYTLATKAAVRLVRDGICSKKLWTKDAKVLQSILFSEMEDEHGRAQEQGAQRQSCEKTWNSQVCMVQIGETRSEKRIGKDKKFESNEKSRNKNESIIPVARDEAQTFRAWGKWSRNDIASAVNEGCFVRELDSGITYITGETSTRFSDMLQSGLRQSRIENSNRNRRGLPSQQEESGYKKGHKAEVYRVDSVEVLEQGHPELEKYRDEDGFIYFYDIKAKRHPSFSVNGLLVHNSSILKAFMGKTRRYLQNAFQTTPHKLCCTATPAPNDHMELGNHAEFLNIMPSNEMLARWFINDTSQAGNYRLKQHAIKPFWEWVSTWAVCLNKPSDLGFDDGDFELPELTTHEHVVDIQWKPKNGKLVDAGKPSATDMYRELRETAGQRTDYAAEMVNASAEPWIVWCNTNNESEMLARKIPDAVEIKGSMSNQAKEEALEAFVSGRARVMVGKPSMCGFGLNLQHCHNMAFVGLSYSFEQRYQAIRRCWRFGQKYQVDDYVIVSPKEQKIFRSVQEKAAKHQEMEASMVANVNEFTTLETKRLSLQTDYQGRRYKNHTWEIIHGDSCKEMSRLDASSMHFSIHSPPFAQLYIYSDYVQDLGNCKSYQEFFNHYSFVVQELFRITKPGRLAAVHCKQLVTYKNRDGRSGLTDFRGDIIKLYERHGWKYHSEVCIWKDPVTEMQRTKAQGLLHKQIKKDSSLVRQGLPDYLVIFRKWEEGEEETEAVHRPEGFCEYIGENAPTVTPKNEKDQIYSIHVWQRYASPVWWDIDQMNVLNYRRGKGEKDEKHICPLQLDVIERAIHLWTNPGDTVFTPFAGIGSEVYSAVKMKRKAIGIELKEEYVKTALKNMKILKQKNAQGSLFDIAQQAEQEAINA